MVGASREQVIGRECFEFINPTKRGECSITVPGQNFNNPEQALLTAAGKRLPIFKSVVPVTLSGRKHLLESFSDLTELKEEEAQKLAKEPRFGRNPDLSGPLCRKKHVRCISCWWRTTRKTGCLCALFLKRHFTQWIQSKMVKSPWQSSQPAK